MTYLLFAGFCVLQALDVATTLAILNRGGRELNPVMAWLIRKAGALNALVIVKACLVATVYLYALTSVWLIGTLAMAYLAVVGWNYKQASKITQKGKSNGQAG